MVPVHYFTITLSPLLTTHYEGRFKFVNPFLLLFLQLF